MRHRPPLVPTSMPAYRATVYSTSGFDRAGDFPFQHVVDPLRDGQRVILDGFDLVVPAGQIAAVVGPNGAGKSTLIKLLCRLYDPVSGRIELDGVDVRDFALSELRVVQRTGIGLSHPTRDRDPAAGHGARGVLTPSADRRGNEHRENNGNRGTINETHGMSFR